MSNKYFLISEQEINDGLANGIFSKDNISLIRNETGQIVKHLKEQEIEDSPIPSTLVQVHHNIIYQADLSPIIDSMIEINNVLLFEDLEEIYQVVLDKLRYYKSHKQRLDELNSKTLEALSIFEKRLKRYLDGIDTENPSQDDRFFGALDSYLNLIFIYMISAYWLHNNQLSNDTIASDKIDSLESVVRDIYKKLLINNEIDSQSLQNSVYAHLYINCGSNIHLIDKLIKHDDRCTSAIDFFESFRDECISSDNGSTYRFNEPINKSALECRLKFSERLYKVMEKIGYLRNIFNELIDVGSIHLEEVDYGDNQANKKLQLTVIPLALHNDS